MTFDEAIKEINGAYDLIDYTDMANTIDEVVVKLQAEYAPTVAMTKEQAEHLNSIIREVGEVFEPNEIPTDVKLTDKVIELESGFVLLKYLNVILHPETIKVVDTKEQL